VVAFVKGVVVPHIAASETHQRFLKNFVRQPEKTFSAVSAQNGHADRIPRCPVSGAERKTFARIELFRF
jgi:hypothetical protein